MSLTFLYNNLRTVIPVKAGIQVASGPKGPLAQRENTGFRVKPGMTIKVKGLLTQYTRVIKNLPARRQGSNFLEKLTKICKISLILALFIPLIKIKEKTFTK